MNEKIFREYDIRGIADTDLEDNFVEALGFAIGCYAGEKGARIFTLGRDCRESSVRLSNALSKGLCRSGLNVIDIGLVATPVLYYSIVDRETDGGVMITGSHNPSEYNGFKICIGKASVFGTDIQNIKKLVADPPSSKRPIGELTEFDIRDNYLNAVTENIQKPLSIDVVVDSGNGMGGLFAPEALKRLGCKVDELFSEPISSFPNHHPDPTVPKNLETLIERVREKQAPLGIAFDGDADRIGVVDKTGRILFGDELLILYSREVLKDNPGATVISEVKASHRFFNDVRAHGGNPVMWKTGHSLIKSKMKELDSPLAGEMSGHMFFADRYFGFDDAIYAAARIVEIVAKYGKTPSELLEDLPGSFATPEIRFDCPDDIKFSVVDKATKFFKDEGHNVNNIDGARIEFPDGWGLVRASNTQPVLVYRFEAQSESRLVEIRQLVENGVSQFLP